MDEEAEEQGGGDDSQAWMLSFGDLVSLMLVFFVMLFSMSTLEVEEFEAIVSALSQQFNPSAELARPKPSADMDIPKIQTEPGQSLDYLHALFEQNLAADANFAGYMVHRLDDRLVISIPAETLFTDDDGVELRSAARQSLSLISDMLRYLPNRVDIDGHDDPGPIASPNFASHWELSLARAVAVANEMRAVGFDRNVHAFGFGDSRYEDLSVSRPAPERYTLARRIDIVIRDLVVEGLDD